MRNDILLALIENNKLYNMIIEDNYSELFTILEINKETSVINALENIAFRIKYLKKDDRFANIIIEHILFKIESLGKDTTKLTNQIYL